ncbi:cache domain-containing protein, partial [Campylobacter jejuni]|uniref:cache domain-containing protein n=1 Tax=Campylobacter jejuni TaxID=197 RepID=UPI0005770B88
MKKFFNKSANVSTRLTLWVGFLVVLVLVTTSAISYVKSKNNTYNLLKENQLKTMDDVKVVFENYGKSKRNGIQILADTLSQNSNMNDDQLINLIRTFQELKNYNLVYVTFEDTGKNYRSDNQILDSSKGYDTKNRPWYQQAKSARQLIVTEPYQSVSSGKVVLTYAAPFYDKNGNLKGVVGGDYNLDKFSKDVLSLGYSSNTYAAVYDSEGRIIFHEKSDKMLTKNTLSINIANAIKENPSYIDPNKNILFTALDDKGTSFSIMCNIGYNPLFRICTVTQTSVYTSAINKVLLQQTIVGIVAIIVALILVRILISRSLSPLAA